MLESKVGEQSRAGSMSCFMSLSRIPVGQPCHHQYVTSLSGSKAAPLGVPFPSHQEEEKRNEANSFSLWM